MTTRRATSWATVIDAQTGEVIEGARRGPAAPAQRPELPAYPQADFDKNLPAWTKVVAGGKKTASALLAMLQTKGTFTEEQKAVILSLKPTAEDATPVDDKGTAGCRRRLRQRHERGRSRAGDLTCRPSN